MSWCDEFPHKLFVSVLLDEEGKILNWKVGNYYWKEPLEAKMRLRDFNKLDKLSVQHKEFTVNNWKEHNKVFSVDSKEWFRQFELAADHIGASPFIEDDFFSCEGVEVLKNLKKLD